MFCTIEQYGKVLVVVLVGAGQTTLVVALAVGVRGGVGEVDGIVATDSIAGEQPRQVLRAVILQLVLKGVVLDQLAVGVLDVDGPVAVQRDALMRGVAVRGVNLYVVGRGDRRAGERPRQGHRVAVLRMSLSSSVPREQKHRNRQQQRGE
jgi:hypothetical protein